MRLVQLEGAAGRRLATVEEPNLRLLSGCGSVYELAQACIANGRSIPAEVERRATNQTLPYDDVYGGHSAWRILPSADHPSEPARCLVTGTGLTHMASAKNRQAMHGKEEELTDSMRMYRWGVEGGKPPAGSPGVAPEWFYKGCGTILRGHNDPLTVPFHAEDGGEEPEIAVVYLIDACGTPRRVGMTPGNEFSDHETERKNYLYLAASKLRTCSIGPELVLDADFATVPGEVTVEREGRPLWQKRIQSGETVMSHSLANLEHHHFKFEAHRRPGDLHVHFLGADAFSFGEGIHLQDGDFMQVRFDGFGRALRNPVKREAVEKKAVQVQPI
ncbi:MAG TPA: AraD1 family protein [Bryobacteraceae bacterium]|nr:AraD1 family protein [Bryobacteraceae bacterium]